jgi:GTPase
VSAGAAGIVRCGYVALVGRPNVGKSTLLNTLLGTKLSIVTPKPHTTRQRTLGVLSRGATQFVFMDTPGLHEVRGRPLNRLMNDAARQAMADADVVLVLLDAERPREGDDVVIEIALASGRPVVLGVNKTDRIRPRDRLLPLLAGLPERWPGLAAVVPVSARDGDNLDRLLAVLEAFLPHGPALFPEDMITDRDVGYRLAETVREKLMLHLREELPYGVAVALERLERDERGRWQVGAVIWVEQDRHKGMVIGKGGQMLKTIGSEAREDLAAMLDAPVHLELWVRVRSDWSRDHRALRELGLTGESV